MRLGPLTITRPIPWNIPVEQPPSVAQPAPDMFALIAAVTAWRDARQAVLDLDAKPITREGRLARMAIWNRYSKAEAALMALARKLGGGQ